MRGKDILEVVKAFAGKLPKFADGRINYSNSASAAILSIFVMHGDEMLLLKRSDLVSTYHGKWSAVAGYFDEVKQVKDKALEELYEEIGLKEESIKSISVGSPYEVEDKALRIRWIICPVIVDLNSKPLIKMDWEHTEYVWVKQDCVKDYDSVPYLAKSMKNALK